MSIVKLYRIVQRCERLDDLVGRRRAFIDDGEFMRSLAKNMNTHGRFKSAASFVRNRTVENTP